jgi:hypothetical protein
VCAEASAVLRAVAADFFFNFWYLEIRSVNRIRHVPRCVHYHAQGIRLEKVLEFLCRKWEHSNGSEKLFSWLATEDIFMKNEFLLRHSIGHFSWEPSCEQLQELIVVHSSVPITLSTQLNGTVATETMDVIEASFAV